VVESEQPHVAAARESSHPAVGSNGQCAGACRVLPVYGCESSRTVTWSAPQSRRARGNLVRRIRLLPATLSALLPLVPLPAAQPYFVLGLLIPALTYVLVSWVWLIGRILHDLGGKPRGGHPISANS
jgi:hypothetical protein